MTERRAHTISHEHDERAQQIEVITTHRSPSHANAEAAHSEQEEKEEKAPVIGAASSCFSGKGG